MWQRKPSNAGLITPLSDITASLYTVIVFFPKICGSNYNINEKYNGKFIHF
jgi:hypothetical protein